MKDYLNVKRYLEQGLDANGIKLMTDLDSKELNLIIQNIRMESKMQALGAERYLERQNGLRESGMAMDTDTSMKRIKEQLKPMANSIIEFRDGYKSKKPHVAVEFFKRHDPFQLALQTLRMCIVAETTGRKELGALCTRLTGEIESGLETPQAYRIGYKLIQLMCNSSMKGRTAFQITKRYDQGKTIHVIEATDEFYEWEEEQEGLLAEMSIMYRPMVVPPRPWTGLNMGGYWDSGMQRPFIRNMPKATERTHGINKIPRVYEAVNKIQATPFTVNQFVLDTANELMFDDELFFDKWFQDIPERPHSERVANLRKQIEICNERLEINPENRNKYGKKFGEWVRNMLGKIGLGDDLYLAKQNLEDARFKLVQYVKWRETLTSIKSKNRVIKTALETANEYANFERLYFPCNLDWRMRVYPLPSGLTTQGVCLQKALIKFADGKPLSSSSNPERALQWLMVHTANSFGKDKESWLDRIKWTEDNKELIQRIANDPVDSVEEWKNTDDPWLFIAACEQMNKYYEHGMDAVIDIPIPMDGTCNGAQHYAAMTKDLGGAYGVNVAPNGTQGLKARLDSLRAKIGQVSNSKPEWENITTEIGEQIKKEINYTDK